MFRYSLLGPAREHGIAVFAGGAVQTVQFFVKRHGCVGIAGPGNGIDQLDSSVPERVSRMMVFMAVSLYV